MLQLFKTDASNPDFIALVKELDTLLAIRDGDDHAFYDQFNKLDNIKHVIVGYENETPVGCGAIKQYNSTCMEIKRMFTSTNHRGKGIATQILEALEIWTKKLGITSCILETGINQHEAIALYKKRNYQLMTKNYGQYKGVSASFCFEKRLV